MTKKRDFDGFRDFLLQHAPFHRLGGLRSRLVRQDVTVLVGIEAKSRLVIFLVLLDRIRLIEIQLLLF